MLLAASSDYPLLNVFWTTVLVFAWVIWFWLLIVIFGDLFRRRDISGWGKAGWFLLVLVLPYLGVFIYLVANGGAMAERRDRQAEAAQSQFDDYVRSVVVEQRHPADQIDKGKQLLDNGTISADEFEALKRKALT
jgi:hypothetical protein